MKKRKCISRPVLEPLHPRILLSAVSLLPNSGDAGLRSAIHADNTNAHARNRINLGSGQFTLTNFTKGNLLIRNNNADVSQKTLIIDGAGQNSTIIEPGTVTGGWHDRIFQIVGANVTVVLENLTIQGGDAVGGGVLGGTAALGGGILIDGAQVTLSSVT